VDGEAEDPVAKRTKYSQDFFGSGSPKAKSLAPNSSLNKENTILEVTDKKSNNSSIVLSEVTPSPPIQRPQSENVHTQKNSQEVQKREQQFNPQMKPQAPRVNFQVQRKAQQAEFAIPRQQQTIKKRSNDTASLKTPSGSKQLQKPFDNAQHSNVPNVQKHQSQTKQPTPEEQSEHKLKEQLEQISHKYDDSIETLKSMETEEKKAKQTEADLSMTFETVIDDMTKLTEDLKNCAFRYNVEMNRLLMLDCPMMKGIIAEIQCKYASIFEEENSNI
jgi:hypothetical protein